MKKTILLILVGLLLLQNSSLAKIDYTMPESIKVGLYYGGKALSTVKIKGNGDMEAGYIANDKFVSLYTFKEGQELILDKDSSVTFGLTATLDGAEVFKFDTLGEPLIIRHYIPGEEPTEIPTKTPTETPTEIPTETPTVQEENESTVEEDVPVDPSKVETEAETDEEETTNTTEQTEVKQTEDVAIEATEEVQTISKAEDDKLKLITVQGKQYRGEIHIRRYSDSDITVVSVVNMEDYLSAVVPAEIGPSSPKEAIKAQTIAAKNFALDRLNRYEKWGFDVTNTTYDQVYEAYDKTRDISDIINEVKGEILTYEGEIAKTFFFSTSGGYTANVKDVWSSDYPYLTSVEDKYEDPKAPKANWEVAVTPKQWAEKLKANGCEIGDIKDVKITETDKVGRVLKIEIIGTKDTVIFEREKARISLGIDGILSQWYTVTKEGELIYITVEDDIQKIQLDLPSLKTINGDNKVNTIDSKLSNAVIQGATTRKSYSLTATGIEMYRFNGKGWGHGIGMSQMGAIGMAKAGFDYKEILTWYFKGTEISKVEKE